MKLPFSSRDKGQKQPRPPRKPFDLGASVRTRSFRVGGYSVAAAAIVLAIAVAVNVLVGALPDSMTQIDTTSSQLFTISDQTEQLVAGLEEDVTIYWIVQSGSEDATVRLLLDRYAALGDRLTVEKRDPDVYPTFLQQYELSSVYNNSLVVECGDKYRYVSYYDIYQYDYSSYYSYDVSFAGESAVTSAIDYVTSDDLPKLYLLTGHGEVELSSSFQSAVADQNVETESLSLLSAEAVPEDADAVLIYAPQSDLAAEEVEMLQTYLQAGGNLILITDPPLEGSLTNLEGLMAGYGVTAAEGIVVEGSQSHYALGTPYYLLPTISYHDITSPLTENGYYVLLPIAQGLTVSDELPDGVSVTELLTTSDSAYSKVDGYSLTTYEKEDGDLDGPFALAVAITDEVDEDTESKLVWVSSASLLDDQINQQVAGGNEDLFLNAISWMCGQEDSISIHAKSLSYEYLTMDSGTASLLTVLVVGVLPLAYLAVGLTIWIRRKRR